MKKISTLSYIAALCCLVLFAGCQGKSGAQTGSTQSGGAALGGGKDRIATILVSKATLYTETDGTMNGSKQSANLGEVVAWKNSVKESVRAYDKATRTFAKIGVDKDDFWIQDVYVAPDARPGVIIGDDVVLYTKPEVTAPSGKTIPKDTIVGVHADDAKNGFTPISAYITGAASPVITKMYVKNDRVNTADNDIQAMQLITLAQAEKNPVIKKELLTSAKALNSSYGDIIDAEFAVFEPKVEDVGEVIEAEITAEPSATP